jgi:acyl-CoA thioesterase
MTEFSDLMASVAPGGDTRSNDSWRVGVSDDWLQGRTAYGGLSAALCLQAAMLQTSDLPPLRSAQLAFVGPATGELTLSPTVLRRGKSAVFVGVDCHGEAGLATRATFCFGAKRPSTLNHVDLPMPRVPALRDCKPFFRAMPGLNFTQHFDGLLAAGALPFSREGAPSLTLWLRHKDERARASAVALLALADAPPPAAIVLFAKPAPISTMMWQVDVLTDDLTTDDGWWLVRTSAETLQDGYSGQNMAIWNAAGRPVIAARQTIAVFG